MDQKRIVKSLENDNVLTTRIEKDNKKGILYVASAVREERYDKVIVVQVDDKEEIIEVGDTMVIRYGTGTDVTLDDVDYTIVNKRDILFIQ